MSLTIAIPPHHRTPAPDAPSADRARAWLANLPALDLPAFAPVHSVSAGERTPAETAAAARAAACPDLFVVHAADPAVGEPVIVEVARFCQIAAERVLVLSPDPTAADRIVERLVKGGASVVRALADDENPLRPLPLAGKATSVAILASRTENLPREAAAAVAAIDARLTAIERLIELSEKTAKLDPEVAELTARADAVAVAVRAETGTPLTQKLDSLRTDSDATGKRLEAERQSAIAARAEKVAELAARKQEHAAALAEGTKKPGFLARLFGGGKHGPDAGILEKQITATEGEIAAIDAQLVELRARVDGLVPALAADREKIVQEEIAIRRGEIDSRLVELAAERQRLAAEAETLGKSVGSNPPTADELVAARYAATRDLLAAREYAAEVNRNAPELARRSLFESRVVVGTPASLRADPVFDRGGAATAPPFDLLVLDRAEELTEHDFLQLAKLASRWVLVGDAPPVEAPKAQSNGAASRRGPSRNGRPAEVRFASRLAHTLDRETWGYEADRLVCRLTFPTPDRRPAMTREPLLDRPEIELRFLAGENGEPVLAEVAFPGGTAIAAARSFLFHQLGEVLLRPCGAIHWHHTPTAISACWPAAEYGTGATAAEWIDLEPGVREKIVGHGLAAFTAAVAFDTAQGWDADRAAAWLEEHTPAPSASRFAPLPAASPSPRRRA